MLLRRGNLAKWGGGGDLEPAMVHLLLRGCCRGVAASQQRRPATAAPRLHRTCNGQHAHHHALQMLLRLSLPGPLARRIASSDQRVRWPLLDQPLDLPVGRDMHRSMRHATLSNPRTSLPGSIPFRNPTSNHYYDSLIIISGGCRVLLRPSFHFADTWPQHFLLSSR